MFPALVQGTKKHLSGKHIIKLGPSVAGTNVQQILCLSKSVDKMTILVKPVLVLKDIEEKHIKCLFWI